MAYSSSSPGCFSPGQPTEQLQLRASPVSTRLLTSRLVRPEVSRSDRTYRWGGGQRY